MATLLQISELRSNATLARRVEASISKQAMAIISSEVATTPNHKNRIKWAYDVMDRPQLFSDRMMWFVAGHADVQAAYTVNSDQVDITDSHIDVAVAAAIDNFAG